MKIIKYLEHNNEKYFVGDHVILNSYNKPEISCTIDSLGNDEFNPRVIVISDNGGLIILKLDEIESIRKHI